jgi:preprotein translocase subunit SecB
MSKMSPKEYSKKLSGTQLNSVYLIQSASEIDKTVEIGAIEVRISDKADFINLKDKLIEVHHQYNIQTRIKKKEFFKITVKFCVELHSEELFDKELFEIFSKATLPSITIPYMREFVGNMTSRMNIPPLTIPLIKRKV